MLAKASTATLRSASASASASRKTPQKKSACVVFLPELALQIVWRDRPSWRHQPVAVVTDDSPDAPLRLLSVAAVQLGLRPGIRQGPARNLAPGLRIAVVCEQEVEDLFLDITRALQSFSPRVERVEPVQSARYSPRSSPRSSPRNSPRGSHSQVARPGSKNSDFIVPALFVDPSGFDLLYGGKEAWAKIVDRYLRGRGLHASIVVGFDRFRCLAVAQSLKNKAGIQLFQNEKEERARSHSVSLRALGFPEKLCDPLSMLDVDSLGEFLALPPGELKTRFGKEAAELHARFSDDQQLPLQPMSFEVPRRLTTELLPPEQDKERLLFRIKTILDALLLEIKIKGEHVAAISLEFHLERYGKRRLTDEERRVDARLEPAAPTLDARSLLELIRLRLAKLEFGAPVEEMAIEAEVVHVHGEQLSTVNERPRRNPHDAALALARVAAAFGKRSVCRAHLRDAHLPEAQFVWSPFEDVQKTLASSHSPPNASSKNVSSKNQPESAAEKLASLSHASLLAQRRLLPTPEPLASDGQGGFAWRSLIVNLQGPYRLSGGWWNKESDGSPSIYRDYYYASTESGDLLWVFFDKRRKRWFLHGRVE